MSDLGGARVVRVVSYSRERDRLGFCFSVDEMLFHTSIWYKGIDLLELERRFGDELLTRVYFHIAAFTVNQFVSLAPREIDFGPFAQYVSAEFARVWQNVVQRVWAQWRYENKLPRYAGPRLAVVDDGAMRGAGSGDVGGSGRTVPVGVLGEGKTLLFSGGGKDSVACQTLLEQAGIEFDCISYSHSIYGAAAFQHEVIGRIRLPEYAGHVHEVRIYDDFLDSPVLQARPEYGISTLCAAETPSSIFIALPIVLAGGYGSVILGHEKSADFGNLLWAETGEEVNHQWGKSLEAEMLLNQYIADEVFAGTHVWSILKPLGDVAIVGIAATNPVALREAHSCNIRKPWCRRCAKCAYVWLLYQALLPQGFVDEIFGENLFDVEDNVIWFRQMLGLEEHTPFECVGQPYEARLAFEVCRRKGLDGLAMRHFVAAGISVDVEAGLREQLEIDEGRLVNMPTGVRERVRETMARMLESVLPRVVAGGG